MLVTLTGIDEVRRLIQLLKTLLPIKVTLSGRLRPVKAAQPLNTLLPI